MLDPKRQRADAADDDGPAHATGEWDLADHRREMTRTLNRRAIEIGTEESAAEPRTCFGMRGRGLGTADSNLCVAGCCCRDEQGNDTQPWHEQSCQRTDAAGIAERRVAAQREGHRLAGNAKPGMWIVSQDRLKDEHPLVWPGLQGARRRGRLHL